MSAVPAILSPRGPFIVPPIAAGTSGVDFLGLRQVNLELTAACFPGISNVTRLVRPFSVLAWIHWKFSQQAEAAGRMEMSDKELRAFQEKVELLFTWGHQLQPSSAARIPGINSKAPAAGHGGWVDLTFSGWKRVAHNTSLQAAVQYGPAMKDASGLGFLHSRGSGFHAYTPSGESLARALDDRLSKTDAYGLVCSLDRTKGRSTDAEVLLKAWHAVRPSSAEAKIFRTAFYQPEAVGKAGLMGQRSTMIAAILETLRSAPQGRTEEDIRRCLVWQHPALGRPFAFSPPCAAVARRWKILQMRQMQRVAMESFLQWFEQYLEEGENRLINIQERLAAAFADDHLSDGGRVTCATAMAGFARGFTSEADYRAQCARGHHDDLLARGLRLFESEEWDPIPVEVARLLMGLAQWTRWIAEDADQHADLKRGGVDRLSLWHLHESLTRAADRPLVEWMQDILERWIIGQHLRVATLRSDGRAQRLRFGFGDGGLEFYASHSSEPSLAQDHLAAGLSLMENCGLIAGDSASASYSLP